MEKIPWLCLVLAVALIYAPRIVIGRAMIKLPGGYDNHDPREQQKKLEGVPKRANAAHYNSFEAFAPFAAGVLACELRHVPVDRVAYLSMAFIAARTLYFLLYVADRPTARSTSWGVGFLCTAALLALPLFA